MRKEMTEAVSRVVEENMALLDATCSRHGALPCSGQQKKAVRAVLELAMREAVVMTIERFGEHLEKAE